MKTHLFTDAEALAQALADRMSEALRDRLTREGEAWLAVSGGRTPIALFEALSRQALNWSRVRVVLVDERCVPLTSPRSNARLVRTHLLQNAARAAPLANVRPDARFTLVVLGMGEDGHTASWFPGGDTLTEALDPAAAPTAIFLNAPGAGETRLTLNLAAVLNADLIVLHIEGGAKADALAKALGDGPVEAMPVRAVLRQTRTPVEIWRA